MQPGISGASSGRGFRMFARGPGLSIRDRILACSTPAEVHALLADTLLVPASPSTRRSWHAAADSRLQILKSSGLVLS